jgi:hypothetical protein
VTLELAPDAAKALRTHTAVQAQIHTVHPDPGTRRHAQRLPSSFQTARVTVQIEGNAAVPLRFPEEPAFPRAAAPPSLSLLPSALPAQVSPGVASH